MEIKILHVEDNPDDAALLALAFRKASVTVQIDVATDGTQAVATLQAASRQTLPALVLLDNKLPSMSGLEVLAWIRRQSLLIGLPVVFLTSSNLQSDIQKAYELGVNAYLVKPLGLEGLVTLARTIDLFWLRSNIRPYA